MAPLQLLHQAVEPVADRGQHVAGLAGILLYERQRAVEIVLAALERVQASAQLSHFHGGQGGPRPSDCSRGDGITLSVSAGNRTESSRSTSARAYSWVTLGENSR